MTTQDEQPTTSYDRMLASGQMRDPVRQIPPAGKSTTIFEDSAERDLKPEVYFPVPPTPTGIRKYQKSYVPGEINVHWGLKDQKLPDERFSYGMRTNKGENVEMTFKAGQKFGIEEYINSRGEAIYHSTQREPLGKPYIRGHELPGVTKESTFPGFGKESEEQEDGKLSIFPRGVKPEDESIRKMYVRTHGNYAPGEMLSRNYEWPNAVKQNDHFRFGVSLGGGRAAEGEGAKAALNMEIEDDGSFPVTKIVRRTAEDFRHVNNDKLCKSKNMMQGAPPVKPGHQFGLKPADADVTAGECVRGWYSLGEQLPDADLGRCVKPGRRNVTTEKRAFGTPSVRADIPAPRPDKRSVADTQNYGDEVGASALLNPQRFELQGVPDKEFLLRRPKAELQSILENCGYRLDAAEFDTLWDAAVKLFEDDLQLASLDAFMFIYSDAIDEEVRGKLGAL